MAYQGLAGLYRDFFGVPHMFAVVKLLGSRSLPAIIRALLDHISSKVSSEEHFTLPCTQNRAMPRNGKLF